MKKLKFNLFDLGLLEKSNQKFGTISYIFFIFILYWLFGNRPLVALPWQGMDDGLYLHQAESILKWIDGGFRGPWLGEYKPYLLSKAPLFAIFLALINGLGLPLRITEFAMLIVLPFMFKWAWKPILPKMSNMTFWIITLIIVAQPQLWFSLRLERNTLNAILVIACLISVSGYVIRAIKKSPMKYQRHWAILIGSTFALCYLNREEAFWLGLIVIMAFTIGIISSIRRYKLIDSISPSFLGIILFSIPITTVAALNFHSYGSWITTMRRSDAFSDLYKYLTTIEPASEKHFVPISQQTCAEIYTISPTFAMLRPTFDISNCYANHNAMNGQPADAKEFYVSYFEFVLLESAYNAGAKSAGSTEELFKNIKSEIQIAINGKKIKTRKGFIGFLSVPLSGDYLHIFNSTFLSLYKLITFQGIIPRMPEFSSGEPQGITRIANISRSALFPTEDAKDFSINLKLTSLQIHILKYIHYIISMLYWIIIAGTLLISIFFVIKRKINKDMYSSVIILGLLLVGIICFSFVMGVLNVLGWPHLQWPYSYNIMGYAPLSVAVSTGVVIISLNIRESKS